MSASALKLAIQVLSTIMLARLLTPADFGLVTMVTTFSLLLVNFGLNGFTEALIQCEEIDQQTASNLFWLNIGIGLALTAAFASSATLLARIYGNALVADVVLGISAQVFFASGSTIHLALVKRAMRFAAISANDVSAHVVYSVVALALASKGWGYWALVAGLVASGISMTVGAFCACRWVPSLPRLTSRTKPLIRFAATVYGRFCLRYATQNIDNLLVGWRFNAVSLGLYKKAYDLFVLSAAQLTTPLHDVALAALSRMKKEDRELIKRNLASSLSMLGLVGMGVGANLTLAGSDMVRLVLGPQWDEAGRIFGFFGPGIGIMLVYSTIGWIHLSVGRPDRWLRWSILELLVTTLLFVVGIHWGPVGVAAAWSVSYWLLLIPAFSYAGEPMGLGITALIQAVWKYAVASLVAGLSTVRVVQVLGYPAAPVGAAAALESLIVKSAAFLTLYVGVVILFHGGVTPLRQIAGILAELGPLRWRMSRSLAASEGGK